VNSRTWWTWARPAIGLAMLALLVLRLGAGPFVDGLRSNGPVALAAAGAITAVTTACCAWRWRVVAAGLAVPVTRAEAFGACYRSQFLNATLPGGVVGDVDRAIGHGRSSGRLGPSARSVAWERSLGQVVQVVLSVTVVVVMSSRLRSPVIVGAAGAGTTLLLGVLLVRVLAGRRAGAAGRAGRVLTGDLSRILGERRWLPVLVASAVAASGHIAIFLIAAASAGVPASPALLLPVACVVLLVAAVPVNLAGWGPREGAAAWAFGAAGLTASQGVTVAVGYGVLAFVATVPGLVVLLARRRTPPPRPEPVIADRPEEAARA
jgi:glycosyltransferase 2 family protein